MSFDQIFLFALLFMVLALLVWGRIRYDVVAFGALFAAFLAGVVPREQVFSGLGHPATIIVALVLVVSRGLSNSGAIEMISRHLVASSRSPGAHIGIMAGLAAGLSAIMNNVAALALLMPIDMKAAAKAKRSPSVTLMPLSFATILGGMVTLIGTPPNVVIATFREEALGKPYAMFDFAPVGAVVAVAGIVFVAFIGWRLIPAKRRERDTVKELEELKGYVVEGMVPETSETIGKTMYTLRSLAEENDVDILGLVRYGNRLPGLASSETIRRDDVLVLEGGPDSIEHFLGAAGLTYAGSDKHAGMFTEALRVAEVVVPEGALIEGRTALDVGLMRRQGVTLLGVSRRGQRFSERVRSLRIWAGDILLLHGQEDRLPDVISWLGCLPLAERGLRVTQRRKSWLAVSIFAAAIASASLGWIYLPVALGGVAVAYVGLRIVSLSQLYESVEWPVIVLLGSLIPVGAALDASGGAALIADTVVTWGHSLSPSVVLAMLMAVTMTLSGVLNNVATALIAAPIGVRIAECLDVNPDPFLMAVAVAASCAFLTPVGHKNNTIIMGPGGYQFGDYWRMGILLEVVVILVGVPMILAVWPL